MNALFSRCDAAEYLSTEAHITAYLNAALEENDPALAMAALGDIVCARAVHQLAADSGLPVDQVFRLLSGDGSPALADLQQLAHAMGLRLSAPKT